MERWVGAAGGWESLWGAGWGRWPCWELLAACAVIGAVGWLLRLRDRRPGGRRAAVAAAAISAETPIASPAPQCAPAPPAAGSQRCSGSRPGGTENSPIAEPRFSNAAKDRM